VDAEQVPAPHPAKEAAKPVSGQTDSPKRARSPERRAHNTVKHATTRASRKKGIRKGGFKSTRFLTHAEFRQTKADVYALVNAGYGPTVFLSIRPAVGLTDRQKQDRVQRVLDRFGGALKRRGVPFVCMRTYEKKRGGGSLHGHALLHVPKKCFEVIERLADRFDRVERKVRIEEEAEIEIHARVIGQTPDDLRKVINYALKQHRWNLPGYDGAGSARQFFQKGDPIRGRRLAFSKHARAILAEYEKTLPTAFAAAPEPVPQPIIIPIQITEPVQLALDLDAPVIDVRALVEETRVARGLTQREAGALIGYRQPGYSNAVVRRHDPLSVWSRNRALEFIGQSRAA
jgi:hypothetical protein